MGGWLKADTSVTVKLGPFVDDTDFKTAETGLTIQKADVRVSKNGGNLAAANADQGVADAGAAHDELGFYDIALDDTDTNTEGRLRVIIVESGALPVWDDFMVLAAQVYDSLVAGTDDLDVQVSGIDANAITATAIADAAIDAATFAAGAIDAAAIAADAIDADAIKADAGTEIGTAVWATTVRTLTAATNLPSAADMADAVWDEAVAGHTTGTTFGGKLQTAVSTPPTANAIADQVWDETLSDHSGVGSTGAALSSASGVSPPDASAIADAVWDEAVAGHTTATTFGGKLQTAVSTPPTANAIADQVWDEAVADHTGATTFGGKLQTAVSTAPTAASVADAVWDETLGDHAGSGSTGEKLAAVSEFDSTSDLVTVGDVVSGAIDADALADNAIGAAELAGDAVLEIAAAVATSGVGGAGSETVTVTVTDGINPIDGVAVWVSTDVAMTNVVAGTVFTDAFGQVELMLDAGDYYLWRQRAGYNFENPYPFTVTDE